MIESSIPSTVRKRRSSSRKWGIESASIGAEPMKSKRFGEKWVVRLETGERVVETLTAFCEREKIRAGSFTGVGTCRGAELGFFDWEKKRYRFKTFKGDFEITALVGNISVLGGMTFVHAHVALGDREFRAIAGHLKEAETLATCEVVLAPLPGVLRRVRDAGSGTSTLKL
ncbi:MAG: DNA-binding protein [Candidatus Aminicenantes bacterium]|nr:DNA-binding protein [Candidatus Aminicenantes bacterium]